MSTAAADTTHLAAGDIRFIKEHLGEWLAEQSLGKPAAVYEIELRERMIRVEEELGHQRELIKTVLEQMDKRFEAMQKEMDRRFDAVDKRFEALQKEMDRRFEAMQKEMDRRFDAVDKRFETLQSEMNRRFEALTRRIDRFMIWSYAVTLTVGSLIVAALKLLP